MTIIDEAKNEYIARWHCCECHKTDISGGIRQASKTRGVAGHCYWCFKPVEVYFGRCRKPPNAAVKPRRSDV